MARHITKSKATARTVESLDPRRAKRLANMLIKEMRIGRPVTAKERNDIHCRMHEAQREVVTKIR